MRSDKLTTSGPQPQTRNELQAWVREQLTLPPPLEAVAARRDRRRLHAPRAALAGIEAGGHSGAVGRLRRQDGARPDRALRQGRHRQQHLALLRSAGRRPHRQVASRSEDEADELRPLHRAARVVPGARAARPLVRGRPRRHHRIQVVQRRARPRGRRSHHRARRGAAARAGAVRRPAGAGARRPARRRISTRGSAATSSAS